MNDRSKKHFLTWYVILVLLAVPLTIVSQSNTKKAFSNFSGDASERSAGSAGGVLLAQNQMPQELPKMTSPATKPPITTHGATLPQTTVPGTKQPTSKVPLTRLPVTIPFPRCCYCSVKPTAPRQPIPLGSLLGGERAADGTFHQSLLQPVQYAGTTPRHQDVPVIGSGSRRRKGCAV